MKKSLILASAIATVLAAPLAHSAAHGGGSAATVYGKLHVDVKNNDLDDNWEVESNSSRIGFKGSEDLGNGMKAIWQYEQGVSLDGGGFDGNSRNAYLGLAGDFGQVRIGRHDTPAKTAFYAAGNDRIGDSIIDLNSSFGFSELRANNVIAYISPKMGALSFAAAIIPGEGVGSAPTNAQNNGLSDGVSVGLMYKAGGIKAALGFTDTADVISANTNELMNLGGSYAISDTINVGLQYQTMEAGTLERTAFALTGEFSFGDNSVVLMFGNAEDDVSGATTDADVLGLGLKHMMSKRTTGYVAFVDGDEIPGGLAGDPFDNGTGANGGDVVQGSKFSIGLIHNF